MKALRSIITVNQAINAKSNLIHQDSGVSISYNVRYRVSEYGFKTQRDILETPARSGKNWKNA